MYSNRVYFVSGTDSHGVEGRVNALIEGLEQKGHILDTVEFKTTARESTSYTDRVEITVMIKYRVIR